MNQGDTIESLKDNDLGITVLPFWFKKTDLSKHEKSERPFDIEWSQTMHRLCQIEYECVPTLTSKQQKAETLCVYLRRGKPYYVHRRSTKHHEYEWLVKVSRYNLECYEKKLLTHSGRQELLAKEQEKATEEAKRKAQLNESYLETLDKAYQLDKERLQKDAQERWAQERKEVQNYIDKCMYHACAWLYGHSDGALRNQEAWRLAEQEEEEESNKNSRSAQSPDCCRTIKHVSDVFGKQSS